MAEKGRSAGMGINGSMNETDRFQSNANVN